MSSKQIPSINSIKGELYSDQNFDSIKYFYECYERIPFTFNDKEQRLQLTKRIIRESKKNYENTSEQIVDNLMDNYHIFMNIGKYITKIDDSISKLMSTEKNYSSKLQSLRAEIEELTFNFDTNKETANTTTQDKESKNRDNNFYVSNTNNIIDNSKDTYFSPIEENNSLFSELDKGISLEEFMNPKPGTRRWLQEIPEKINVFVEEKNFKEAVNLILLLRKADLMNISYTEKLKIDESYNFFLEKLTLSISKAIEVKDLTKLLDLLLLLKCDSIARDSLLDWISKKLKQKIRNFFENEDETFLSLTNDSKIVFLIETFYSKLNGYLRLMTEYFENKTVDINEFDNQFIFRRLWYNQQVCFLNDEMEILFCSLSECKELKKLISVIGDLFDKEFKEGCSSQYINSEFFISNFKLGLESICANLLKEKGSAYDLVEYKVNINDNKDNNEDDYITFTSCSELGYLVSNSLQLIIEFLETFRIKTSLETNHLFITLEHYFFNNLLAKDIIYNIKAKINEASNLNSEVKTFSDCTGSLPGPNHILLVYTISLNNIQTCLSNLRKRNPKYSKKLKQFYTGISNTTLRFNQNLFKGKLEWHFFKAFNINKTLICGNNSSVFAPPDSSFTVFFFLLKSLIANLKKKNCSEEIIFKIIVNSQVKIFLSTLFKLVNIENYYDSEITFKDIGINGLELLLHGIFFIKNSLTLLFGFKNSDLSRVINEDNDDNDDMLDYNNTNNVLDNNENKSINEEFNDLISLLIKEFSKNKNLKEERFLSSLTSIENNVVEYIAKNKFELTK